MRSTKSYIKAFVLMQLGARPLMSTDNHIGNKFYDLLRHTINECKKAFANNCYNTRMKIYVSYHTFCKWGAALNETNSKNFKQYIEAEIKFRIRHYLDFLIYLLLSFEANLPEVRPLLCIYIESWSDDSMKKDYYQYCKCHRRNLLYEKKFPHCPIGQSRFFRLLKVYLFLTGPSGSTGIKPV